MPTAVFTPQGVHDPLASLPRSGQRDGSWLAGCVLLAAAAHGIGALTIPRTHTPSPRAREAPLEVIEVDVPPPPPAIPAPLPTEPVQNSAQLKPAAVAKGPPPQAAQGSNLYSELFSHHRSQCAHDKASTNIQSRLWQTKLKTPS